MMASGSRSTRTWEVFGFGEEDDDDLESPAKKRRAGRSKVVRNLSVVQLLHTSSHH